MISVLITVLRKALPEPTRALGGPWLPRREFGAGMGALLLPSPCLSSAGRSANPWATGLIG